MFPCKRGARVDRPNHLALSCPGDSAARATSPDPVERKAALKFPNIQELKPNPKRPGFACYGRQGRKRLRTSPILFDIPLDYPIPPQTIPPTPFAAPPFKLKLDTLINASLSSGSPAVIPPPSPLTVGSLRGTSKNDKTYTRPRSHHNHLHRHHVWTIPARSRSRPLPHHQHNYPEPGWALDYNPQNPHRPPSLRQDGHHERRLPWGERNDKIPFLRCSPGRRPHAHLHVDMLDKRKYPMYGRHHGR